jgi:hypothetical protein
MNLERSLLSLTCGSAGPADPRFRVLWSDSRVRNRTSKVMGGLRANVRTRGILYERTNSSQQRQAGLWKLRYTAPTCSGVISGGLQPDFGGSDAAWLFNDQTSTGPL